MAKKPPKKRARSKSPSQCERDVQRTKGIAYALTRLREIATIPTIVSELQGQGLTVSLAKDCATAAVEAVKVTMDVDSQEALRSSILHGLSVVTARAFAMADKAMPDKDGEGGNKEIELAALNLAERTLRGAGTTFIPKEVRLGLSEVDDAAMRAHLIAVYGKDAAPAPDEDPYS